MANNIKRALAFAALAGLTTTVNSAPSRNSISCEISEDGLKINSYYELDAYSNLKLLEVTDNKTIKIRPVKAADRQNTVSDGVIELNYIDSKSDRGTDKEGALKKIGLHVSSDTKLVLFITDKDGNIVSEPEISRGSGFIYWLIDSLDIAPDEQSFVINIFELDIANEQLIPINRFTYLPDTIPGSINQLNKWYRSNNKTLASSEFIQKIKDFAGSDKNTININGVNCIINDAASKKSIYSKKGSGTGGCYLTTATTESIGLTDDCWELASLRKFRDRYKLKGSREMAQVNEYYAIAPDIVRRINARRDHAIIWHKTWLFGILPAAVFANLHLDKLTGLVYTRMTNKLLALGDARLSA